ncbi:hypothetical protein [Pseudomonas frederiksbergensis]|uniref:hypothetical protein n=1 Tax=Pseudomonas frederiksbergensis TaxID=104087 RepID=UPI0016200958|nr:hypothetical protein [Pseudomonas frederiksbergensis]
MAVAPQGQPGNRRAGASSRRDGDWQVEHHARFSVDERDVGYRAAMGRDRDAATR